MNFTKPYLDGNLWFYFFFFKFKVITSIYRQLQVGFDHEFVQTGFKCDEQKQAVESIVNGVSPLVCIQGLGLGVKILN